MPAKCQDVYIAAIQRAPVGKAFSGAFAKTRPDDLLADTINAVLKQTPKLDPAAIEDVIVGCAMPEAEQGLNIARIGLLLAGLPDTVPGMTINRFCSSGVQSIALAAERIACGHADLILAGGVESMSLVPMGGNKPSFSPKIFDNKEAMVGIAYSMGTTAEVLAKQFKISREDQDEFALESHLRALTAIKEGWFNNEICPITVTHRHPNLHSSEVKITRQKITTDEGPRKDTSLKKLLALPPVFAREGSVSAGNSSQISDGAAMAVVASGAAVKKYGLKPLARFCGFSVAGVDPKIMGVGPVYAVPKVLKQTGIHLKDIGWIELNEAFAVQALTVMHQLKLDPQIVNPVGGAIALGHPLGATGAILTAKCLYGLQRTRQKYGLVTMCIGTGMGAAALFQAY